MKKLAILPVLAILLCGFTCTKQTQNLATASDAIAHSLVNARTAAQQGVTAGTMSQLDETQFEEYLSKAAQAGLILDQGIRQNESATTLSGKTNSFLDAFKALNNSGVAGIKDQTLRLTISTIITGAESSVAIIAATTGAK